MADLGELRIHINTEKLEEDIRKALKAALLGVFQDIHKCLEVEPDGQRKDGPSKGSRPDSLGA